MKKTFRRILSALLVAVMLVGFAPVGGIDLNVKSSAESGSSYKTGDIIEFGSYPQSRVTDEAIIDGQRNGRVVRRQHEAVGLYAVCRYYIRRK